MNTSSTWVFICILAMTALGHFLPKVTRPDLFFGVTVDPAFRNGDEARRIVRSYRVALWSSSLVAGAVDLLLHRSGVALFLCVLGICCAQVASHRSALTHAAYTPTPIEVDLSAPQEHIPGGWLAAVLPLIALVGLGLWAVSHVNQLPSRLAVHWGFAGANRWVVTSPRAIILLLAQHAALCLLLAASALGLLHWSRRISASGPSAAAERQFRRRAMSLILTAEYFVILPPVFALLQAPALAMTVWSVAVIVTTVAFVISLMHTGQGGARLVATGGARIGDRTPDARWIGGLLYFNPADPALLVERRLGIGWTLNLGNPRSWTLAVAVAAIVAIGVMREGANLAIGGPFQAANSGEAIQHKSASPGTEDSLRRYILSLEQGHPDYENMSPQLAAAVSLQLPRIMATINRLGTFESLTYEGVDTVGADVYTAVFARGRLEWHVAPLVDGKVAYRHFRRLLDDHS